MQEASFASAGQMTWCGHGGPHPEATWITGGWSLPTELLGCRSRRKCFRAAVATHAKGGLRSEYMSLPAAGPSFCVAMLRLML